MVMMIVRAMLVVLVTPVVAMVIYGFEDQRIAPRWQKVTHTSPEPQALLAVLSEIKAHKARAAARGLPGRLREEAGEAGFRRTWSFAPDFGRASASGLW